MITDFVRPTEVQLKYTMHFENHSLPFGNRELWNMCKIHWSPLTKSPLSSMQTDATLMLANNQGHPTTIFGKYLFRRRFEI